MIIRSRGAMVARLTPDQMIRWSRTQSQQWKAGPRILSSVNCLIKCSTYAIQLPRQFFRWLMLKKNNRSVVFNLRRLFESRRGQIEDFSRLLYEQLSPSKKKEKKELSPY